MATVGQTEGTSGVKGRLMLQAVLNALFPCVHRRTTFPRSHCGAPPGAYVVCLDCGREIPYNWGWTRSSPPAALAAGAKGRQRRESAGGDAAGAQREPEAIQAQAPPETAPVTQPPPQLDATADAEASGEPAAIQAQAPPETAPVTQPPPRLDVTAAAEANGEPEALPIGGGDGLAAGIAPVASQPERGSSLTDESVCFTLASKDLPANGAGDSACQPLCFRLPARPGQTAAQPIAPTATLTEAAFPAAPVFRPSLFSTSESGVAEAPNGAHSTVESDARRYLERAGLRSRKVQVALRVLNSLMTGASAQPGDVALLVSWADPSNRGRSIGELAREVVEWAGSC